ncbi:MAG: hypothetical protein P8Z31_05450 [Gammaproteobacteria bacterium]
MKHRLTMLSANLCLLLTLLLIPLSGALAEEIEIPLGDGADAFITRFPADGEELIVWFPSEFGPSPRLPPIAQALASLGIEVWMPDLHATWFLPVGRYSLGDVDPDALMQIMRAAQEQSGKRVYLMAPGRTAALGLEAIRGWQVAGAAAFIPAASATNVPLYLLQPEQSAYYWRSKQVRNRLEEGGAQVYLHILKDAGDGFYARSDYSAVEESLTRQLPQLLQRATRLLAETTEVSLTPAPMPQDGNTARHGERESTRVALLKPYRGNRVTPPLSLHAQFLGDLVPAMRRGDSVARTLAQAAPCAGTRCHQCRCRRGAGEGAPVSRGQAGRLPRRTRSGRRGLRGMEHLCLPDNLRARSRSQDPLRGVRSIRLGFTGGSRCRG